MTKGDEAKTQIMGSDVNKLRAIIVLVLGFILGGVVSGTTVTTDSLAYELQRSKVNQMLENRKLKFGEYDHSLQSKTGVFGIFKTKGDMQRSIDILKQIIVADNAIFVETKKLLDLKDYEKAYFQRLADEYDIQRSAYMKTISKLQQENEKLRQEVSQLENQGHDDHVINYYALLVIILLVLLLAWQYRKSRKRYSKYSNVQKQ